MKTIDHQALAHKIGAYYKPSHPRQFRSDDWQSAISGIGLSGKDRRVDAQFYADHLTSEQAAELWSGDDLAARVVEVWPNEMLREGWDLRISEEDGGQEMAEEIEQRARELELDASLWLALAYERAYGGAAIFLGANDGQELDQPLNIDRVTSLDYLLVCEPRELQPIKWYRELGAKFGKPEVFNFQPISEGGTVGQFKSIHESRFIIFPGIRTSRRGTQGLLAGWGSSHLSRANRVLRDFNLSWAAAGNILQAFNLMMFKMKGLYDAYAADRDDIIQNRLKSMVQQASTIHGFLLDAEDDFDILQSPVTGLAELLDKLETRMSAAADMPRTLLMGSSPDGMNATGASDIKFFQDRVRAAQTKTLTPRIKPAVRLIMKTLGHEEPEKWDIDHRPLTQKTGLEEATERNMIAKTDEIYANIGVFSPLVIGEQRFGGDGYSPETVIDIGELEKQIEEELAAQAEAEAKMQEQLKQTPDQPEENQKNAPEPKP